MPQSRKKAKSAAKKKAKTEAAASGAGGDALSLEFVETPTLDALTQANAETAVSAIPSAVLKAFKKEKDELRAAYEELKARGAGAEEMDAFAAMLKARKDMFTAEFCSKTSTKVLSYVTALSTR
jgi:hypothetical protein